MPTARRGGTRLVLIPAVGVLILAIPGGTYAYATHQLGRAQAFEAQAKYAEAVRAYLAADALVGNALSRLVFTALAERAESGAAQTRLKWGKQEQGEGNFTSAEKQYDAVVLSHLPRWQSQANAALAELFLAWGDSLVQQLKFEEAISQYRRIKDLDRTGALREKTAQSLAGAYAAYAASLVQAKPPDYPEAITWYENLVQEFPQSPEAQQAITSWLPHTLFQEGLAYVDQKIYDLARDAMRRVVKEYPLSPWAAKASGALNTPQPLTGRLLHPDGTPVPNRLLRISTKWRVVSPRTYDDSEGQIYAATTDASGNFSLLVPPGQNYLVTWWDPVRQNFVTTFIGDDVPVNQISINPLEPVRANVSIA